MPKIACPSCHAHYNVPEAKLGKRVKCAKCGEPFVLTPPAESDELFPELEALSAGRTIAAPPPPVQPDAAAPAGRSRETKIAALAGPTLQSYLSSVAGFVRIVIRPGEAVTLGILCAICTLQVIAPLGLCVGWLMMIVINGWYQAFLLRAVVGGAAGDDELPNLAFTDGILEDIIYPGLKFFLVSFLTFVPALAAIIFAFSHDKLTGDEAGAAIAAIFSLDFATLFSLKSDVAIVLALLLLLGLFLQPMLLLIVAIGDMDGLIRLDRIAQTIARSLPGYVAAVAIYFGATALGTLLSLGLKMATSDTFAADADPNSPGSAKMQQLAGTLVGMAIAIPPNVLLRTFAMRAIGLYYHHFKKRFAWSWG